MKSMGFLRLLICLAVGCGMLLTNANAQRVTNDLVLLYEFDEGTGSTIYDKSGYGVPLNLQIANTSNVQWLGVNGVNISSATILESTSTASKVTNAIKATDKVTMEAWVKVDNTSQTGPARIMTISENTGERNMTLGQSGTKYVGRMRSGSNNNGTPDTQTSSGKANNSQIQHIVYTHANGTEKIYVNGSLVKTASRSGDMDDWDDGYKFAIANELTQNRSWLGEVYIVAMYKDALTQSEVTQNYNAGYQIAAANPNEDWVEAECGDYGALWQVKTDGDASQGRYLEIQSGNTSTGSVPTSTDGHITYDVEVSTAGNYYVIGRILTPSGSDNSFWVKVNNSSWAEWHTGTTNNWMWERVSHNGGNTTFYMNSGSNTITVAYREDGSKLDKLFVSQSAAYPNGYGIAAPSCVPSFTPPADGWSFDCGENVEVELVGHGVKGYSNSTLNFSNPSSIDSVVLMVTSKNGGYPSSLTFTGSNGQTVVATPEQMPSTSNGSNSSVRTYSAKLTGNISSASVTGLNNHTYSYIAYVFRTNNNYEGGSVAMPVGEFFYHSDKTYTMAIPAGSADRDIVVTVPISELDNDTRIVEMTVTAGGITETITENTYDLGKSLKFLSVTLQGVPAGTDEIEIEISSPSSNGDSFAATGYITADLDCSTCTPPTIYTWTRINYGTWKYGTIANACVGDIVELCVDPVNLQGYVWSGPNGFTSTLSTPIISDSITTNEEGVYNLTYTDPSDPNCTVFANFTVNVSAPLIPTLNLPAGPLAANQVVSISATDVNDYQKMYIPVGSYFTGAMDRMILAADDDATGAGNTMVRNVRIYEYDTGVSLDVNFNNYTVSSYGNSQDNGTYTVSNGGNDFSVQNNAWKSLDLSYTVTKHTILEFEVKTTDEGEIHFIGFDDDSNDGNSAERLFVLFGDHGSSSGAEKDALGVYREPVYNWNFGLSASSTVAVGMGPHSISFAGGQETISLRIDQGNCNYYYEDSIDVECPMLTVSDDVEMCECDDVNGGECQDNGRAVTLTASGGTNYQWSTGETTPSITVSPLSTTTYTVTTSGPGSCSDSEDIVVTVLDGPDAEFQQVPTTALCENDVFIFEAVDQGPSVAGSDYQWDFGPTASPSQALGKGPHQVRFLVTNGQTDCREITLTVGSGDCADEAKANVFIAPAASIDQLIVEDPSCQGTTGSVTLNTAGWVIGESGITTVSQSGFSQWHTLDYDNSYEKPIVVMQSLTSGDVNPAHVRVRNVGHTSLEFQIEEWDYQDGSHGAENISYVVLEQGVHTLSDGTTIEAGYTNVNGNWATVSLNGGYTSAPVVLTQVASNEYARSVVTRQRNGGTTSFQVRLQNKESYDKNGNLHPGNEKVTYIAIQDGEGTANGQAFEAGVLLDVTHTFKQLTYTQTFTNTPALVYSMQTYDGGDPAGVRHQSQDLLGAQLRVEEETSNDSETNHTTEHIGYLAFETGDIYAAMEYRIDGGNWVTAENNYTFDNLAIGSHTVEARTINGCNTVIADSTFDIGAGQCASLGDFVWQDANEDGIQDGGENGIENIKLYLLDGCSGTVKLDSTTTASDGSYSFDNLNVGSSYRVQLASEALSAGYFLVPQNAGSDEALDSDIGSDRISDCVTLTQTGAYEDLDIGLGYECAVYDAGEISGDQSYCTVIGVMPTPLNSVREAEGGAGVEYQWRWSERTDIPYEYWVVKPNSNSASMTINHLVSKTCYLVRMARKCPGEAWVASNVVVIEINYTPKVSYSITYPEGATLASAGDSVKVVFEARTWPNTEYDWNFAGSMYPNGIPLDSSGRKVMTYYNVEGSYFASLRMFTPTCDSTLDLYVIIDAGNNCDNITDPGYISGNQYSCSVPYDASPIGGTGAAGGSGSVEYDWAYSHDINIPVEMWASVPGGNATDLDPDNSLGLLTQTTYFVRKARTIGCNAFAYSNIVTLEVQEDIQSACELTEPASQTFGVNLPGVIQGGTLGEYDWHYETATVITYADGTAKVTGLLRNLENENMQWRASIILKERKDWLQWQSTSGPYAGNYVPSIAGGSMDHYAWDYYEIDAANSYLVGEALNRGDSLTFSQGYVQVGVGANGVDLGYGVYAEFVFGSTSGNYSGTGTLTNELQNCREVCLPQVKVAARIMTEGAYNQNTGLMNDNLKMLGLIPLSQPFAPYGYTESITVDSIPNGVSDWILIQVRSSKDSAQIIEQAVGFMKLDGDLVGLDGESLIELNIDPRQNYFMSVIAKGHLGVMTKNPKLRQGNAFMHDFTANLEEIYSLPGTSNPAMTQLVNGQYAMWAGDTDLNGTVNSVDFNQVLLNYLQAGYFLTDIDLSGFVNSVDYQFVANNYFKFAQLPIQK